MSDILYCAKYKSTITLGISIFLCILTCACNDILFVYICSFIHVQLFIQLYRLIHVNFLFQIIFIRTLNKNVWIRKNS